MCTLPIAPHALSAGSCSSFGPSYRGDGCERLFKSNDDWSEDHGNGPAGTMIRSKARRRLSNIHSKLYMPGKTCVRMWIGGSGQWDHGSIYEKASTSEACSTPTPVPLASQAPAPSSRGSRRPS